MNRVVKLLAWVTTLVVCVAGVQIASWSFSDEHSSHLVARVLVTQSLPVASAMYLALAALPLALSALRLTTLRVAVCCGVLMLAAMAALTVFHFATGPYTCEGHCPDPGSREWLNAERGQNEGAPLTAAVSFAVVAVLGLSALGCAIAVQGFIRRIASGKPR